MQVQLFCHIDPESFREKYLNILNIYNFEIFHSCLRHINLF